MSWRWFHREEDKTEVWTGFLEEGVRFEGKLVVAGVFRVDGQVKGTIVSEGALMLGEHSRVEGEVRGKRVSVAGHLHGVIFASERVKIQTKGVVTGEIDTPCLVLEAGAIFDGDCHMLGGAAAGKTIAIPIRSGTQG